MAGDTNKYANTRWTRYIESEMEISGTADDSKRTWSVKLPNGTLLTSSYSFLPKNQIKKFENFNIIIMDEQDRKLAKTFTNQNMDNINMSNLSSNSICHLRSLFHFNERMVKGLKRQKKCYWRVIPEIESGLEEGPEEARIMTEGLWEILYTVKAMQGCPLRTDDDRVGALEVKYKTGELNTIPLSELEEILEDFDVDKSRVTLIDDPMHIISERDTYKLGIPVKTYNLIGQPIMSFNQAMLFMTESLLCGVDWRKVTVEVRQKIWKFMEDSMEPIVSTNHYIKYSYILKCIIDFKKAFPSIHNNQIPLKVFLLQNERPGEYLRCSAEYEACAIRFGYDLHAFKNRNTQVWQLRVQGIFGAVDMFTAGLVNCNYLDLTIRDALMFLIPEARRSTYRMFFDEKEIFDLDEDGDERCRVYGKLDDLGYQFHFHNKHTIRGTKSRRIVYKYIQKMTPHVMYWCDSKPSEDVTSSEKKKKRRCRKCRAQIERLDAVRKKRQKQRNALNDFGRFLWDRYRPLRDGMKMIQVKQRQLRERALLKTMPMENQRMEFEISSYKITLPILEAETREEQEKCEELFRKNQELRKQEAYLMSQLEVEDILNLCFNKNDGRAPGLSIYGPNKPLWVPEINLPSEDPKIETSTSTKKEFPRLGRLTRKRVSKNSSKNDTPDVLKDDQVERFLEKEWSGWRNHGGERKEEERATDLPTVTRKSKKTKPQKTAFNGKVMRSSDSESSQQKKILEKNVPSEPKKEGSKTGKEKKIDSKATVVKPTVEESKNEPKSVKIQKKVMEATVALKKSPVKSLGNKEEQSEESAKNLEGTVIQKGETGARNLRLRSKLDSEVKSEAVTEENEAQVLHGSTTVPLQDSTTVPTVTTAKEVKERPVEPQEQFSNDSKTKNLQNPEDVPQKNTAVSEVQSEATVTLEVNLSPRKKTTVTQGPCSQKESFPESFDSSDLVEPTVTPRDSSSTVIQEDTVTPSAISEANSTVGLLVPLQYNKISEDEISKDLDQLEEQMKNLEINDDETEVAKNTVVKDTVARNRESEAPKSCGRDTVDQKRDALESDNSEPSNRSTVVQPKASEASGSCDQDTVAKIRNQILPATVTKDKENQSTVIEAPPTDTQCSSSSIPVFKKPMEPIQLNFMEHQDPALLIQKLLEETKDSKPRPSRIQVDVRSKEIDEKDLTSPSSVPEDPATSLKTLKILRDQNLVPTFDVIAQAVILEKDRRIEELEKLCQELQAKSEELEQTLSQSQPSTSTPIETQLKMELQEKDAKILELEDSNRDLQLKIKHQEEFIDKLLKR